MSEIALIFGIGVPLFIGLMFVGFSISHGLLQIAQALRERNHR